MVSPWVNKGNIMSYINTDKYNPHTERIHLVIKPLLLFLLFLIQPSSISSLGSLKRLSTFTSVRYIMEICTGLDSRSHPIPLHLSPNREMYWSASMGRLSLPISDLWPSVTSRDPSFQRLPISRVRCNGSPPSLWIAKVLPCASRRQETSLRLGVCVLW
jgi:hypothetical protein